MRTSWQKDRVWFGVLGLRVINVRKSISIHVLRTLAGVNSKIKMGKVNGLGKVQLGEK